MGKLDKNVKINVLNKVFGTKDLKKLELLHRNLGEVILKTNAARKSGISSLRANKALMKDGIKKLKENIQQLGTNKIANQGFIKTLFMGQDAWTRFNRGQNKFKKSSGRLANNIRKGTSGLRGFRMEMLSVMFAGMFLTRTLTGLLRTSLEWTGVNEVLSTALGVLFLPVALLLLDWAIAFLGLVTKLSPSQKKWIGTLVLVGIAIGGLLFLLGTFTLAIGGIIMALGSILTPLGLLFAIFLSIAALIFIPILFSKIASGLDYMQGKVTTFGVSGDVFSTLSDKIKDFNKSIEDAGGPLEFLKTKFGELIDKLVGEETKGDLIQAGHDSLSKYLEGVQNFISENPLALLGAIVGLFIAGPIGASLGAAGGFGINKYLDGLKDGSQDSTKIVDVVSNIVAQIGDAIVDNLPELLEIGGAIVAGIIQGILNVGSHIGDAIREFLGGPKGTSKFRIGNTLADSSFIFSPEHRASGGPVSPNSPFLVGENGPELFVPNNGGRISPSGSFGGGININQTITVSGSNSREFEDIIKRNNIKLTEELRRLAQRV